MSVENGYVMMMNDIVMVTYDCWLQASRGMTRIYLSDYFSQMLLVKSQLEFPPCYVTPSDSTKEQSWAALAEQVH